MAGNRRPEPMWHVETWVLAPDTLAGSPALTWAHCAKGMNSRTLTGGHPQTHTKRTWMDQPKNGPPWMIPPKTDHSKHSWSSQRTEAWIRPSSTCPKTSTSWCHKDGAALTVTRVSWLWTSQLHSFPQLSEMRPSALWCSRAPVCFQLG